MTLGFITGVERSFRGPRGRRITGSLEHDAPLLPGSSGGPVVSREGRLLGLNTHRLGEGFYLAIPADEALRARVDALGRGESQRRVRLGIGVAPSHVARGLRRAVGLPDADGLLVRLVEDDSPASRAGLAAGDLIIQAASEPVRGMDDLFQALETSAGGVIELVILRGAEGAPLRCSSVPRRTPSRPSRMLMITRCCRSCPGGSYGALRPAVAAHDQDQGAVRQPRMKLSRNSRRAETSMRSPLVGRRMRRSAQQDHLSRPRSWCGKSIPAFWTV